MKLDLKLSIRKPSGFALDVSFKCETEALGIVGPSGSGKSTLLNAVAGIEPGGKIFIDGQDVAKIRLHRRGIGYVTQDPLLFPHLTVRENLSYSPRAGSLDDAAQALGVEDLLDRMPRNLSGGERRRAAIARAVASRPSILLLDEPFSGMDEQRRREAMSLLDHARRKFKIPMILVSHVADEVIGLTDQALRLEAGRMAGFGPSASILRSGVTKIDNYLVGTVVGTNRVKVGNRELVVASRLDVQGEVRLACYAHDVLLADRFPQGISARNCFWTEVDSVNPAGDAVAVELKDPPMRVLVTPEAVKSLDLKIGSRVAAIIKATSIACLGKR